METEKTELKKELNGVLSEIAASEPNLEDAEDKILAFYGNLKCTDEGIDDGSDDESDNEYVMYRSYYVRKDGRELHFIIYYGNIDEIVGSYRIYQ